MTKEMKDNILKGLGLVILLLTLLVTAVTNYEVSNLGDIQEQGTATIFTDLQVGDGSASAPAYSFTGDTDTGIYSVGANNLGLAAGGSVILDVDGTDINANALPVVNIGNAGTDFNSSGGLTLATTLTLSDGNLVVADFARITAQSTLSLTNGATFTPTGTYQPIQSAGTVTPTLSTSGYTAGDLLYLINTSNTSIVMVDTGSIVMGGNLTMGQYDTLAFIYDGTRWVETTRTNN